MEKLVESDKSKTISKLIESENEFLNNKGIKLKDIEEAKKKGWQGITIDELDYDIEMVYNKLVETFKNASVITKDEMMLANLISGIKKDKVDLIKFMKNHELKLKELEYKYEGRNTKDSHEEIEL